MHRFFYSYVWNLQTEPATAILEWGSLEKQKT